MPSMRLTAHFALTRQVPVSLELRRSHVVRPEFSKKAALPKAMSPSWWKYGPWPASQIVLIHVSDTVVLWGSFLHVADVHGGVHTDAANTDDALQLDSHESHEPALFIPCTVPGVGVCAARTAGGSCNREMCTSPEWGAKMQPDVLQQDVHREELHEACLLDACHPECTSASSGRSARSDPSYSCSLMCKVMQTIYKTRPSLDSVMCDTRPPPRQPPPGY